MPTASISKMAFTLKLRSNFTVRPFSLGNGLTQIIGQPTYIDIFNHIRRIYMDQLKGIGLSVHTHFNDEDKNLVHLYLVVGLCDSSRLLRPSSLSLGAATRTTE